MIRQCAVWWWIIVAAGWFAIAEEADQPLPVPQAIVAEAVRPRDDPVGRPLPLASHWNSGVHPPKDTFDPAWQIELIEKGHHLLPFLQLPDPAAPADKKLSPEYYEAPIKRLAALKLPISLLSTLPRLELFAPATPPGIPR